MTPRLHIYGATGSCAMATHMLLWEAGLEHGTTIYSREQAMKGLPEELKKLNPKAKVPTLVFDDEVITETPAVAALISQLAPSKNFFGKTLLESVRVTEWLNYLSYALHARGYGMIFHPDYYLDVEDKAMGEHVLGKGMDLIAKSNKYIDEKLEGKTWAVGDDFTAADAYLYVFWSWGVNATDLPMEKDYPNFARLARELEKRPAVQQMLKAEGLL